MCADSPSTITIRFRNPRKLGVVAASWLRHDGRDSEWTAATWRYFLCSDFLNWPVASALPLGLLVVSEAILEAVGLRAAGSAAVSIPVTVVAVFILAASGYTARGVNIGRNTHPELCRKANNA